MQLQLHDPTHAKLAVMLAAVARFRLIDLRQLAALCDGKLPDIDRLAANDLLLLKNIPSLEGASRRVVALTRRGAAELAACTGAEVSTIPYFTPARLKRSLFTLEHTLAIVEVGVALELAARASRCHSRESGGSVELLRWETIPQKLGTSILLPTPKGLDRVPLVGDALFTLRDNAGTNHFLLELDRGTVGLASMRRKYAGYHLWSSRNGPLNRFGAKNLRLLTVTVNAKRMERLHSLARDIAPRSGFFLFGTLDSFSLDHPARLFDPCFLLVAETATPLVLLTRSPGPKAQP